MVRVFSSSDMHEFLRRLSLQGSKGTSWLVRLLLRWPVRFICAAEVGLDAVKPPDSLPGPSRRVHAGGCGASAAPTQLSKVEAGAGGGGQAGGERGVAGRVLQPAGGVGAQPIAALLVTSQLWGRPVSEGGRRKGSRGRDQANLKDLG